MNLPTALVQPSISIVANYLCDCSSSFRKLICSVRVKFKLRTQLWIHRSEIYLQAGNLFLVLAFFIIKFKRKIPGTAAVFWLSVVHRLALKFDLDWYYRIDDLIIILWLL